MIFSCLKRVKFFGRPIRLQNVAGKIFARVKLNRINTRIRDVLRDNQHGFRKGRGCRDLIYFLMRQSVDKSWSLVKNCISVMQILLRDMIQYRERGYGSYCQSTECTIKL